MKHRFLKIVFSAIPLALVVVLGVKMAYLHHVREVLAPQFRLSESKNIIAIGNSHGQDAINDSILANWANECRSAEMNFGTYAMLQHLLAENKIDTLVLPMIDFYGYDDKSVTTQYLFFETSRLVSADSETLRDLWHQNWGGMVSFMMINDISTMLQPIEIGGYQNWHHQGLRAQLTDKELHLAQAGRTKCPDKPWSQYVLQRKYMSRILQLCQQKGVKVVVLNYPKYRYDRYMDLAEVNRYYAAFGDSITIADYQDFAFPDTSCYANVTHLNYRGATIFCNHLRHTGLTPQPPTEWIKTSKK